MIIIITIILLIIIIIIIILMHLSLLPENGCTAPDFLPDASCDLLPSTLQVLTEM